MPLTSMEVTFRLVHRGSEKDVASTGKRKLISRYPGQVSGEKTVKYMLRDEVLPADRFATDRGRVSRSVINLIRPQSLRAINRKDSRAWSKLKGFLLCVSIGDLPSRWFNKNYVHFDLHLMRDKVEKNIRWAFVQNFIWLTLDLKRNSIYRTVALDGRHRQDYLFLILTGNW